MILVNLEILTVVIKRSKKGGGGYLIDIINTQLIKPVNLLFVCH